MHFPFSSARQKALQAAGLTIETVEALATRVQKLLGSLKDIFMETCGVAAPKPSRRRAPCHLYEWKDLQTEHKLLEQAQATVATALAAGRPPPAFRASNSLVITSQGRKSPGQCVRRTHTASEARRIWEFLACFQGLGRDAFSKPGRMEFVSLRPWEVLAKKLVEALPALTTSCKLQ